VTSRRKGEDLIRAGRVKVDGRLATLGERVDPDRVVLTIDDVPLPRLPPPLYYLVNKPAGVVSTRSDPGGRPAVVDMVPAGKNVYPVGRLDVPTQGLLILTNDGQLTRLLTHARYGVTKTYEAQVEGQPTQETLRRLEAGVKLEDGLGKAVRVRIQATRGQAAQLEVIMLEGRQRQVRRMLAAVGHQVVERRRVAIGTLRDPSLAPGQWRQLTQTEVNQLYTAAGQ